MKRRNIFGLAAAALVTTFACGSASAQNYPNRPITLIVPWAAGGGTDAVARVIGTLLEKDLGQPVTVVNRIGGSGVVGHQAIASGTPDGYTLGLITVEITMMHWQKLTELTYQNYTPIGMVNVDPAAFQVRADSPYKTMQDAINAIKAAPPGKFKASGTGQGGIWHLALAGMLRDMKIDPAAVQWVPSQGAAPGLTDMIAGGVEFVPCSLPEARSLIDAGKVRSLAIMDTSPPALYPNLPTLKASTGSNWTMGVWRGIATPKGLPKDIQTKLIASLKKVYDSKEYKDFMNQRGFGMAWAAGDDFTTVMAKTDADMGTVMKAVGLAK
jgi:tripartite-type tricarboxylate transporter receptor subunit TctC